MIAVMTDLAALSRNPDLLRRIAITLAALAIFRAAQWIPLPGLNTAALAQHASTGFSGSVRTTTSIMALGIVPLLSALLLAEFAQILSRRLRRWAETPHGAVHLWLGVLAGALVLTTIQSYGIVMAFEALPGLIIQPGPAFRAGVTASFLGATMIVVWLSRWITRSGIGSGFWVLLAAGHVDAVVEPFILLLPLLAQGAISPADLLSSLALWLGFIAFAAALFSAFTKAAPRLSDPEEIIWSPLLAGIVVTLLLSILSLVHVLVLPAGTPDFDIFLTSNAAAPLLAISIVAMVLLRRRSLLPPGQSLNVAAAIPAAAAIAVLGSGWVLVPNASSALVLVAVALLILENLRSTPRGIEDAPLAR